MDKEKKVKLRSRRHFLMLPVILAGTTENSPVKDEKVKMLSPEGQLVEVDKSVLQQAVNRKKASNKDLLEWRKPLGSY